MAGHQRPGVTVGAGFDKQSRKPFNKCSAIFIVEKNRTFFYAPDGNVLQQSRISRRAGLGIGEKNDSRKHF
jgi:hypothetical protein